MAEKIVFAQLNLDIDPLIRQTKEVKKELDILKANQKELTKEGQTSSKQFVENAASIKILSTAYNNNVKALTANIKTAATQAQADELINDVLSRQVTTIQEAREQNKALNAIRNNVNATTSEGQKQIQQLNNALDANNDFIKDNADQYLKQKINIGNYTDSVKDALQQSGLFGGQLRQVTGVLKGFAPIFAGIKGELSAVVTQFQATTQATEGYTAAQKASAVATGGVSAALRIFRLALIATGIGAVVVVLGSLISFLATTQKGIDAVTSVTRPLQAVFGTLVGVIQQVGEFLFEAFSKPQETLKQLFDFVKNQVIRQFQSFSKILEGIFNLDFDLIKEGFNDLGEQAKENINAIKGIGNELGKQFTEAIKKGQELDRLIKQREQLETNIASRQAELNKALLEQRTILSDTGRTGQERVDAANEAERIQQLIIDNENEILDIQIQELKVRQSLNDTSREENKQLDELIAKRTDNLSKIDQQEKQGIAARKKLQDEAIAAAQKAADDAIKQQQNELNLFIQQQGVKAKTLQEQLAIDEQVSEKRIEILKAELKNRNITQTEFDVQLLEIQNELLQARAQAVNDAAQRELDAYVEANQSKIDSDLFFSEQSLQVEQDRLNSLAEKRREFAQKQLDEGIINQTQFNDAINKIDADNREKLAEAQAERDEAQREKEIIDLENKRIAEEEATENRFVLEAEKLERQRQIEVEAAERTGADVDAINKKYAAFRTTLENQVADAKIQATQQSFNAVAGLLGQESALGKVAAVAAIINNTVQESTKAFNTAAVLASNPLTAALAPNATIQGVRIIATGAANIAKTVSPKLEQGGIVGVGGKRHSQGGTKFVGEDGTTFEAEKGEGIGVLNRAAFDSFMNFNNAFGSGKSRTGFFEGGGIISRAIPTAQDNNFELLQAIQNLPPPIVTVEDIRSGNQSFVEVASGANV